ncbi:MAG TPA: TRAP transporter small permease [Rikenellaceae bacterium]|nr:TRAP transporter small permease [Rikenellaceae bacterium]
MNKLLTITFKLSKLMNAIAGISLSCMMTLTVADVILRYFRMPIVGTYEIVGFLAALVIGFSMPFTSWIRGHVGVDFAIAKMRKGLKNYILISTRIISILLFLLAGIFLFRKAFAFYQNNEVSLTLQVPLYPVACAVGACCFCLSLVLLVDIVKIKRGNYE